ncbi:hypothetical protein Dimus_011102 [Dionaea muscipula]
MLEEDDFQDLACLPLTQSRTRRRPDPPIQSSPSPSLSTSTTLTPFPSMAKKKRLNATPSPPPGKESILPDVLSPFPTTTTTTECPRLAGSYDFRRCSGCSDVRNSNAVESRLLASLAQVRNCDGGSWGTDQDREVAVDSEEIGTQLGDLIRLCSDGGADGFSVVVECPLCGVDISDLSEELRQIHTNNCLDKGSLIDGDPSHEDIRSEIPANDIEKAMVVPPQVGVASVLEWLHGLDLAKYEHVFVKEEIDWDTLQWLTNEDLIGIGITALGPRKKILYALKELQRRNDHSSNMEPDDCKPEVDGTRKSAPNRLITDYFSGCTSVEKRSCRNSRNLHKMQKNHSDVSRRPVVTKKHLSRRGTKEIPPWCCIAGTPFRVDAFQHLRNDCSHWFLTHFHADHYQGLTKSFCYGKIYCSQVTAKLVSLKIGVPWDKLFVLPLNQKISIAGVHVTCFDANHCPGAIIILFEPPNGKAVLHTGDFRFSEAMRNITALQRCPIHTLILDTTYCDPLYDFPKQEDVTQFVIEAIQAESFNPRTLFLIGCYTIGKERLFLEVARVVNKKVHVTAAKLRVLKCLGLPEEDMQRFTIHEEESHIHVVPLWTLASFKRLKQLSCRYANRFSLIISFSPTGWTFAKGKKKSTGRRWQQGTIIRYEVPYSEHSSFSELKEAVKFLSPETIIPSVNNRGKESSDIMVSLLSS